MATAHSEAGIRDPRTDGATAHALAGAAAASGADEPFAGREIDEVDAARSAEYALLGSLLLRAPDSLLLDRLAQLPSNASPIGRAHGDLAEVATAASPEALEREFFDLFIGVGRGELLPYASYYLTGFLSDRPLVRLRDDLARLGLARAEGRREPEDHLGTLCEVMSGFAAGRFGTFEEEGQFFSRHIAPWAERFWGDLATARSARFYKAVGALGRTFMEIETEAFAMDS